MRAPSRSMLVSRISPAPRRHHLLRPFDRIDAGGRAPAVDVHLPRVDRVLLGVDRRHDALRAVARRRLAEEFGILHAGRVDADLVGAGVEQRAHVLDGVHAAAHRQRDEHLRRHGLDHVVEQPAVLDAGLDVEERELVGALLVVPARDLDRIAGIAQVDEIDALDHAAVRDVEAGDDSLRKSHGFVVRGLVEGARPATRKRRGRSRRRGTGAGYRTGWYRAAARGRATDTRPARLPAALQPAAAFSASLKFSVPS